MLFKTVLLIVGLSQVLALPTESTNIEVDFIENSFQAEPELDADTSGTRIVSGWQAYPGQYPHQIYLRMENALGQLGACGGSIVHPQWFITAAHCTAQQVRLLVRAGLVHISEAQYESETSTWYNHQTYDDSRPGVVQPNDMSIAYLPEAITFSRLLQPIRIQSRADAYKDYTSQTFIASGFGRTWTNGATSEDLMWVYMTGVSNAVCTTTYGVAFVNGATICARYFNVTSQSTCQGDNGGPLVHVENGRQILVGVTSFFQGGNSGCHSGFLAGFIRPGPFHNWFTQVTGIDFENLDEYDTEEPTEAPTTTEAPDSVEEEEEDSTEKPEPEEDSSEEKDSDESDDCELSELLKKLQVKVKVKVNLEKYGKKKKH